MTTTPIEQLASLRVGTVEFISPDRIEVQLDIESPDSVALNTGTPRNFLVDYYTAFALSQTKRVSRFRFDRFAVPVEENGSSTGRNVGSLRKGL